MHEACGSFGSILGGYNTLATGSSVQKEFTDLNAHNSVTVDLDFVQIDSWDNEQFSVYADDALVYTSDRIIGYQGIERRNRGHQQQLERIRLLCELYVCALELVAYA